jgi:hypothetical protein
MPRRSLTKQTNFASGELGSSLVGRTDLDRYYNGCKTMLNWAPVVQGGARRASGTEYIATLDDPTRLISFEASTLSQYLFLLSAYSLIIYKGETEVQTIVTPWPRGVIFELDFSQALDTCIFVHQDYAPRRLYRTFDGSFAFEDLTDTRNTIHLTNTPTEPLLPRWVPDGYHFEGEYIQPSATAENGYYYQCTTEGTSGSAAPTWGTNPATPTTDGTVEWTPIGQISEARLWSADKGYPRCVTFHEDRLVLAGSRDYPHRISLSKSGDYFNFDVGTGLADDAIDRELLADQLPLIQWVHSGRRLVIGTTNAEFAVIQSNPITPSEMQISQQSAIGSARITPVTVDGAVLHATRNRAQIRELLYSDIEQAFSTKSMSLLSPLAVSGVVQLAAKPSAAYDDANLVYVVNQDGSLGVLSVLRDQDFLAWFRRTFAGEIESVATVGETVYAVISYTYGGGVYEDGVYEDGVYATTGGNSRRFLCKFSDTATMDFQDTAVTTGAAKTSWTTEFAHLAGAEVQLIVDGLFTGTATVSDAGVLTTPWAANVVTAGLAIPTPTLELMPASFDGAGGNISHMLKHLVRALVQVENTSSLYIDGAPIDFREADDDVFAAVEEYTGVRDITRLGWDRTATLVLTAPDPLRATVIGITREVAY